MISKDSERSIAAYNARKENDERQQLLHAGFGSLREKLAKSKERREAACRVRAKRAERKKALQYVELVCAECGNHVVVLTVDVAGSLCQNCMSHYARDLGSFAMEAGVSTQAISKAQANWIKSKLGYDTSAG